MPCRVGITTNPDARKLAWQGAVDGLENWRILKTFRSKRQAQEYETAYAKKYGCEASPGGAGSLTATWYVYRFDYTRNRPKK